MTLPGAASIPAADSRPPAHGGRRGAPDRRRCPRRRLTVEHFENAISVVLALGGSTNAVIHLIAMAGRAGVPLSLDRFDELSRGVPVLANIRPSGKYLMQDFFEAGGLRALMARLDLHDVMTVTGLTVSRDARGRRGLRRRRHPPALEPARRRGGPGDPPRLAGARRLRDQALRRVAVAAAAHRPRGRLRGLRRHERRASTTRRWTSTPTRCSCCATPARWAARACRSGACSRSRRSCSSRASATWCGSATPACPARPTAPACCTSRPSRSSAGRWRWCRRATRSRWTFRAAASTCSSPEDELAARRSAWVPRDRHATRGYAQLFADHVTQANEGCDFDFLARRRRRRRARDPLMDALGRRHRRGRHPRPRHRARAAAAHARTPASWCWSASPTSPRTRRATTPASSTRASTTRPGR